jgi:uncharacterized protein (DUF305 family)
MTNTSKFLLGALAVIVLSGIAYTQMPQSSDDKMAGMDHSAMTDVGASSATKSFEAAMATMMTGMMTPMTGKPDLDFVQGMIAHHQGAIDMAKVVLQFGKDPEIKTLAENVVKAQDSEITFMKAWLARVDQAALPTSAGSNAANKQTMAVMMKNMAMTYSGDADVDFVNGMIPHHQGAIDMAKVALQFGKDAELLKLAGDVVNAQEGEIAFMTAWQKKHGN